MPDAAATSPQDTAPSVALSDDDAFASGFKGEQGTFVDTAQEAAATGATTEPQTQPAAGDQPQATGDATVTEQPTTEDINARFAKLEATLNGRIQSAENAQQQLAHRLRQSEGRVGTLNGQLLQANRRLEEISRPAPAPAAPSKIDALAESHPELAGAFKELADRIPAQAPAPEPEVVEPTDPTMQHSYDIVERRFPGWKDTVNTSQFKQWLGTQSMDAQLLAESDDPVDAINLLAGFRDASRRQAPNPAPAPAPAPATRPKVRTAQPGTRAPGAINVISDDDAFASGFSAVRGG